MCTSVAKTTFTSPVSIDNGYTNNYQGDFESSLELFETGEGTSLIEWDVPAMDRTEHIGIWHENKVITDYDGVFEVPQQAVAFLKENGYDVSYLQG